jgi:hypothetical protein
VDTSIETSARWWRPEFEEGVVDGDLIVDSAGIRLELHEALQTPAVAENGQQTWSLGVWSYPVIHGAIRNGDAITLLDAEGILNPNLGKAASRESVRAAVCLTGDTWAESDAFTHARVEFDALNAWLGAPSILDEGNGDRQLLTIDLKEHELGTATIGADQISFVTGATGTWASDNVDLKQHSAIRLTFAEPLGWEEIVTRHVRPLQDFLTVALGRPVNMTRLMLRPSTANERDGLLIARLILTQAGPTLVTAADVISYRAPTLLTGIDVAEIGWDIVANWYRVREKFRPVVTELNSPLYAPFNYGGVRYSAIVRAVEAAHLALGLGGRDKTKNDHAKRVAAVIEAARAANVDEQTITWAGNVLATRNDKSFSTRIAEVVKQSGALGEQIESTLKTFSDDAAAARHTGAHGGGAPADDGAVSQRHWRGDLLSWVLRVILLRESGVADADVRAQTRSMFQRALIELADR